MGVVKYFDFKMLVPDSFAWNTLKPCKINYNHEINGDISEQIIIR